VRSTLSQSPIAYVDIGFFAHATEDENKVVEAGRRVFPANQAQSIVFETSSLRGHHGNPITLFEAKIEDRKIAKALVEHLSLNLGELDKESLLREIGLHVEKGSLYIRLDKQAAFQGEFKLSAADPIRVRIRFKKNRLEDVVQICQEIGMLPKS